MVLVGGGARAAYQAGALQGVADVVRQELGRALPIDVISGVSAGAINSTYLASRAHEMESAISGLFQLWNEIEAEHVMKTNSVSLGTIGARWMRDLVFAGFFPRKKSNYLLDTSPLEGFLQRHIDFDGIARNVKSGVLRGVAVSATNYQTGTAISFFDGAEDIQPWVRSSRLGKRSPILLEHVLASASIPILFKPVSIDGFHFGDGGIRLNTPMSPAIHMGADRILAVSVRYLRSHSLTVQLNETPVERQITVADIAGSMLNAAFLDGLDSDVERMERINQTIAIMTDDQRAHHPGRLRSIPMLIIRPSTDLGALASEQFHRFPRALRYMMRGIGASEERGWDFLSYLAFDYHYSRLLLQLGQADAQAQREKIVEFFS